MNVPIEIWQACSKGGTFDAAIFLALKDSLDYDDLLDILEIQEANADHRVAAELEAEAEARNRRAAQSAKAAL